MTTADEDEVVDRFAERQNEGTDLDRTVAQGLVRPPTPFRDVRAATSIAPVTSLELLDRDER